MQMKMTFCWFALALCSFVQGKPQDINNYPFRPTFSDLDSSYYYTTPSPYQQNVMRIWPYILDSAVSPLYNWNWNWNRPWNQYGYSNGYYNAIYGFTTRSPTWPSYYPYGKK